MWFGESPLPFISKMLKYNHSLINLPFEVWQFDRIVEAFLPDVHAATWCYQVLYQDGGPL